MGLKICNVQSFSMHDGRGIRTLIFLAGCPLRCSWCHNPETHATSPLLIYDKEKCIRCGACGGCQRTVHSFENGHRIDRTKCNACGECVKNCPTGALGLSVRTLEKEEFLRLVERQKRLFGYRGGITFTGGEPLLQGDRILEYLDGVDIHTAIETCGYADEEIFKRVIARMDEVMFDLKLASKDEHIKYTGVSNELIIKNLENLRKSGKSFLLRTPLVPKITDTEENLLAIKKLVGNDPWETLSYNELTPVKYERLGKEYTII